MTQLLEVKMGDGGLDTLPPEEQEKANRAALFEELDKMLKTGGGSALGGMSLPEMLGDYQRVAGMPGWYLLPYCLETELRLMELYETQQVAREISSPSDLLRDGVMLASGVVFRLELPDDRDEAREVIAAFARGEKKEEEIFRPVKEREILRKLKSFDDLNAKILRPLGLDLSETGEKKETKPIGSES